MAHGFHRLIAWQRADDLACAVYAAFNAAPRVDPWLRHQARRAALSVPANIAEGYARGTLAEYLRFLDFARGSLAEPDYALHFLRRNQLLPEPTLSVLEGMQSETGRLLQGLRRSLKAKAPRERDHSQARDERAIYVLESSEDEV